ncbi:MAG: hypothetical protein AMXMBFR61_12090 [Fimbriimonadales bacterium]
MKLRAIALFALVTLAGLSRAAPITIMDQIGPDSSYTPGWIYASQETVGSPLYEVVSADDFATVASGYIITKVQAVIGFYNEAGPAAGPNDVYAYRLEIYSSPTAAGNSLSGDVAHYLFGPEQLQVTPWATDFANQHLVTITGLNLVLTPNQTYWVGLIPVMPLQGLGWSGIGASTYAGEPANGSAVQANPNGGFGNGPSWTVSANFAYRIEAVPEPSSAALLGLGALALVRRRR